jgi:hypothetical protein
VEFQGSDDLVQGPRYRWVPINPRQVEIHRLMEVFGPAPAAFYADACRVMAKDPSLISTTHVVGHLLRELESTLREILRPMIPAVPTAGSSEPATRSVVGHLLQKAESTLHEFLQVIIPAMGTAGSSRPGAASEEQERTHKQEIDAIATALGFPPDDEVRSLWKSLQLQRVTHRGSPLGPRPVDDDFLGLWDDMQILLLRLGRQFEASFAGSLPLLDELASKERPDGGDMKKLRGVPHSVVALERFFERAGPGWFALLRGRGYLSDPPPLEIGDDETIAYARWPAGRYLARMAAEPTVQSGVIEVALALETDNPQAHESVVEVALALPVTEAARVAPKIANFLASRYQWALPLKTRELIGRLAQAAEADAALLLLRPLIEAESGRGGWQSAGYAPEIVSAVFPRLGLDGLELLADMLDEALDERRPGARTWRDHYSYSWRPTVEAGSEHGREEVLTSALRDAVVLLAGSDPAGVAVVVEALERRERAIFHRLALHVLRQVPDEQLTAARLGRRELFDDPYTQREYTLLLRARGASLSDEIQARILGWIDAGPQDMALEPEAVDRWRLFQLARFGDVLPQDQITRYQELVERFGEPADDESEIGAWVGPIAPLTTEELLALRDDDLVAFLRSWRPAMDWSAPSREGLRQILEEAASQASDRFATLAPAFAGLDPIYPQGVISGLRRAADQEHGFEWRPVLELAHAVMDKPRALPDRDEQQDNEPARGWVDVRREVAHLLESGLRRDLISAEWDGDIFELLAELAMDPEPSESYEQQWRAHGNSGPVTLDLNTVRGAGFHAIMRYAWWRKEQTLPGQTARLSPQLRELLDRHLDPAREPTETIRSVYGHHFPALIACDEEWARSRVDAIFPRDPSLEQLRLVAWESYLLFNRPYANAYQLLSERYREAIAGLTADTAESADPAYDEVNESLVRHVFGLYAQGTVSLEPGSLVDLFFQHAPLAMRAGLIEHAGRAVAATDEPSPEALERLQRLWDWRRRALQERIVGDLDELKGFGWWIGSAQFDDDWALAQLEDLLADGGTVEPDDLVTTRLAALRHERLAQAVVCLSLLIDAAQRHAAQRPWFVTGARDDIRAILEEGITAEDPETHRVARETTNRLIARGHVQFGDLL